MLIKSSYDLKLRGINKLCVDCTIIKYKVILVGINKKTNCSMLVSHELEKNRGGRPYVCCQLEGDDEQLIWWDHEKASALLGPKRWGYFQ